jgi:hypothetical protein
LKVAPPDRAGLNSLDAEISYGVNEVNAFQVPVETLDKVISSYPNRKLSAIKIDVEGKDFEVLCGAARILKECRPAIVVETDLGGGNAIDIMRSSTLGILRDHGYQLQVISEITGRLEPLAERIHFGSQNILALPQELTKQSTFMRKHTKL